MNVPEVQPQLRPYVDEQVLQAHEEMSAMTLRDVRLAMPELKGGSDTAAYYTIEPQAEDYDRSRAVVIPYTYATGHMPHMYMRAQHLQSSLREPMRLIAFPNNKVGQPSCHLDDIDLTFLRKGDYSPITDRYNRALEQEGIERIDLSSYSQAAAVGADWLQRNGRFGYFDVNSAVLAEAPDIKFRQNRRELAKDFGKTPGSSLKEAVLSTGIPALAEASGYSLGSFVQKTRVMGSFFLSAVLKTNLAIAQGMTEGNFPLRTEHTDVGNGTGIVAHSKNSSVMPAEEVAAQQHRWEAAGWQTVALEGDHAWADNILEYTALAKMAIESARQI